MKKAALILTALSAAGAVWCAGLYFQVVAEAKEVPKDPVLSSVSGAAARSLAKETGKAAVEADNYMEEIIKKNGFYANGADGLLQIPNIAVFFAENPDFDEDIYYKGNETPALGGGHTPRGSAKISGVPLIAQNPELPRGCEVTSLTMLIQRAGLKSAEIGSDKLSLAAAVKKTERTSWTEGGRVVRANPNDGFVGDMYNMSRAGYGVYHAPVYELLARFSPERAIDVTGAPFERLLWLVEQDMPVWVVTNSTHRPLPASEFETWETHSGPVKITWKEHAVLITGYDENFIYFNDPLLAYSKAPREGFRAAWLQMGAQAVSLNP
ncbi:MAG: C39 family peptidase [Clostridiales bacterium]|jgi:uncharacterized protein YvpB|nr:C39 family peptidase [Clostridiales bacterium]